jgi:uncharacterized protein (TIGR04255 family)
MVLEKLAHPPVVEVICGVWFDPVPAIDPLLLGSYWSERRERFPGRNLLPAIEAPGLRIGPPNQRVWLSSADETYVLQIQNDRFYLNWRSMGGEYPRFSPNGALEEQFLEEWARFAEFRGEVGIDEISPRVAEVGKVDHLQFPDAGEIGRLMPSLAGVGSLLDDESGAAQLHVSNGRPPASTKLVLGTARTAGAEGIETILRLETNATAAVDSGGLKQACDIANARVNDLFGALIPKKIRRERFGGGKT